MSEMKIIFKNSQREKIDYREMAKRPMSDFLIYIHQKPEDNTLKERK